jgi:hypothetical protein
MTLTAFRSAPLFTVPNRSNCTLSAPETVDYRQPRKLPQQLLQDIAARKKKLALADVIDVYLVARTALLPVPALFMVYVEL